MHRFFLPQSESLGETLALSGTEAHHALRVLRVREGDSVTVLNGAGAVLACEVTGRARDSLSLHVLERTVAAPMPFAITLLQAIPKGKIIEGIVQKATELGAARIVPILSERVVSHLDAESGESKAERWQQVAIEAIKQSGNPWLPKVDLPVSPAAFLKNELTFDLQLVGCLESGSCHPRVWFERFFTKHRRKPGSIAVWVGPEGDFTADEYAAIKESGALPITLGPLVLRVETAATYCLSVLNYEMRAEN